MDFAWVMNTNTLVKPTMKQCGHCNTEKPRDQFAWRNKKRGWVQAWCRDCVRAYGRKRRGTDR